MRRRKSHESKTMTDREPSRNGRGRQSAVLAATALTLAVAPSVQAKKNTDPYSHLETYSTPYQASASGLGLPLVDILKGLIDRAKLLTNNDTTTFEYFDDPVVQAKEIANQCQLDDITSFTPTIEGKKVKIRLKKTDAQAESVFAHRRVITNTPIDPNVASFLGAAVDCDFISTEIIQLTPMKRKTGKSNFHAFGPTITTRLRGPGNLDDDLLKIKAPGSRPSKEVSEAELHTKGAITKAMRKKGLWGLKIKQKATPKEPGYASPIFWSRTYIVKSDGKPVNTHGVPVVNSSSSKALR